MTPALGEKAHDADILMYKPTRQICFVRFVPGTKYVVGDSPRPNELMIRQFNRSTSFNVTYIPLIRKNIRLVAACTFEIPSKRGFQD